MKKFTEIKFVQLLTSLFKIQRTTVCNKQITMIVAGIVELRIAIKQITASIAPAAPNKCPVKDLVALSFNFNLSFFVSFTIAFISKRSATTVEVACSSYNQLALY